MRTIDLETWSRRGPFEFFSTFGFPHFGLTAPVDLTAFRPAVKQRRYSFTVALTYVLARAANEIPELRYRIRGDTVVEHEVVHPSMTLLTGEDHLSFCYLQYEQQFGSYAADAAKEIARARAKPSLEDPPDRDDWLYLTAIPWVSFTGMVHPLSGSTDSVPRLAWGRFYEEGDRLRMPLNVQVHHALLDGLHVSKYLTKVQAYLSDPDPLLDGA
jgi:chloramphenicol O-acetyltransferase type A